MIYRWHKEETPRWDADKQRIFGDAQISLLVAPAQRGHGIGAFVVDHFEDEARRRGLNYVYNVVPASPDRSWMTGWLRAHGFTDNGHDLRRRVRAATVAQ